MTESGRPLTSLAWLGLAWLGAGWSGAGRRADVLMSVMPHRHIYAPEASRSSHLSPLAERPPSCSSSARPLTTLRLLAPATTPRPAGAAG